MEQTAPPSYDEGRDRDDTVPPVILVLSGRLIHSESSSSPALYYELDHDMNYLSRADHKVLFSRNEQRTRTGRYGDISTRHRLKHIFTLESPHALTSTSSYSYFLTSVSRRTMGDVGLKKTFVPRLGFKAMRIRRLGVDEELFEITPENGRYEWWGDDGKRVAIEDHENGQLKMIITTALPRAKLDVRIPYYHGGRKKRKKKEKERKKQPKGHLSLLMLPCIVYGCL
ncbi:hypothetical protein GGR50DRAFT_320569 [Xylaria sp. CBS 124048]|nr:hypothetical protein GGR50DRAFT_320569 [Xylaria sp. CBS 124048]